MTSDATAPRSDSKAPLRLLGTLLTRGVVPAWILAGATMKLLDGDPSFLPKNFLVFGDRSGIDLQAMLAFFVASEFLLAAVILLCARLAKPVAAFILAVFCAVLIGEILAGNAKCGCLGANSPPPQTMLFIDGLMLLGVLALPTMRPGPDYRETKRLRLAVIVGGVLAVASAGWLLTRPRTVEPQPEPPVETAGAVAGGGATTGGGTAPVIDDTTPSGGTPTSPPVDPTVNPARAALPSFWFESDFASWIGTPWRELDLFRFMPRWPEGLDEGTWYVVWYSRTCDHCEEMFHEDFATNPELSKRTVAIEIPDSKTRLTSPSAWPLPQTECTLLPLPLGPDYVISAPLTIRIENGVVTCATEGDHKECMGLQ